MIFSSTAGIPSPSVSFIEVGSFRIYFYAIFILIGIAIAIAFTSRRFQRRGGRSDLVVDMSLVAIPFAILGGRLYHVATHPSDYFYDGANPWRIFYVWEGGLAIFGSILFGAVGYYIGCRRAKVRFLSFADAVAPGLLLAQAFGRLGNYFNQELFGAPTTLPWGLNIDSSNPAFPSGMPADTLFHPLFLYEILWNVAGALVILAVERRIRLRTGGAVGLYMIIYGTGRAWFETLRIDPSELLVLGMKVNTLTALVVAVTGVLLVILSTRRTAASDDGVYRSGHNASAAGSGRD